MLLRVENFYRQNFYKQVYNYINNYIFIYNYIYNYNKKSDSILIFLGIIQGKLKPKK